MRLHDPPLPGLALLVEHFEHLGVIAPTGIEPGRGIRQSPIALLAVMQYLLDDSLRPGGAGLERVGNHNVSLDKAALGEEVLPHQGIGQIIPDDSGRSD